MYDGGGGHIFAMLVPTHLLNDSVPHFVFNTFAYHFIYI